MAFFRKRVNDKRSVAQLDSAIATDGGAAQTEPLPAPLVSVVIPVYNSMPYLTELLNSLEAQDLSPEDFEVIAVNDGSTDFGGEILDVYAKRNRNFRVIHQENSGWPGKPRNVGIRNSRGKYVFFVDGDDRLGPQALRRMTSYAEEHGVDVLVPKMIGIDGRRSQVKIFEKTILDVPYDFILRTLSPQKMIRKSLLESHGIRFVEEKARLEDGMAMVQAYSAAKRISILADYNYYEIRLRADGQNISRGHIEPAGYVASLTKIAQTVQDHAGGDNAVSRQHIAGLFKRKGLSFYKGQRYLRLPLQERTDWVQNHRDFLHRFGLATSEAQFTGSDAQRVAAILGGDLGRLEQLAMQEAEAQRPPEVTLIDVDGTSVKLSVQFPVQGPKPTGALMKDRDSGAFAAGEVVLDGTEPVLEAVFRRSEILQNITRLGNVFIKYAGVPAKRIKMGKGTAQGSHAGLRVYGTAQGFLSIDRRKAQ